MKGKVKRRSFFFPEGRQVYPLFNTFGEITFLWKGGLEWESRLLVEAGSVGLDNQIFIWEMKWNGMWARYSEWKGEGGRGKSG